MYAHSLVSCTHICVQSLINPECIYVLWLLAPRCLKNWVSHIDASHSRQPLVKGERLVRYEVNAVMQESGKDSAPRFYSDYQCAWNFICLRTPPRRNWTSACPQAPGFEVLSEHQPESRWPARYSWNPSKTTFRIARIQLKQILYLIKEARALCSTISSWPTYHKMQVFVGRSSQADCL